MGTLVAKHEIQNMAEWYFTDAYCTSSQRYSYIWPSPDYPYHVYMYNSKYGNSPVPKVKIRQWIESALIETVIMDDVDLSYTMYSDNKRTHNDSYNVASYKVTNCWYRFSFQTKESAIMFSLVFGEQVRSLTTHSPDWPHHEAILKTISEKSNEKLSNN
jgi:hypothetical protein